jgi:hypothetical protein
MAGYATVVSSILIGWRPRSGDCRRRYPHSWFLNGAHFKGTGYTLPVGDGHCTVIWRVSVPALSERESGDFRSFAPASRHANLRLMGLFDTVYISSDVAASWQLHCRTCGRTPAREPIKTSEVETWRAKARLSRTEVRTRPAKVEPRRTEKLKTRPTATDIWRR